MNPDQSKPSEMKMMQREYATVLFQQFAHTFRTLGREGLTRLSEKNIPRASRDAAEIALCDADEQIYALSTRDNLTIAVSPRDIDIAHELHFTRGNHAGASIQYTDRRTRTRAVMTVSGGLRDPQSYYEENVHDTDWALRSNHPRRTDEIIEKPISLTFCFFPAGQQIPSIQTEIRVGLQTMNLSGLTYNKQTLPVYPKIQSQDGRFGQIVPDIRVSIKHLLTTVPNLYYPI
jgi:hypothetical protein